MSIALLYQFARDKQTKESSEMNKGAGFLLIGLFAWAVHSGLTAPPTPGANAPTPPAKATATQDAAEVGDTVQIKYPSSTILCRTRNDASLVYIAGEYAVRESFRLDKADGTAMIKAQDAARKVAMRDHAPSCYWASSQSDAHYIVQQKEITGTEADVFHDVSYRIKQVGETADWWLIGTYGASSPFEHVDHPADGTVTASAPPAAAATPAQPVAATEPEVPSTRPAPEDFLKYESQVDEPAIRGGFPFNVGPAPVSKWTNAEAERWMKENPELLKQYDERRWRAEFAMLYVFQNGCPQSIAPSLGLSRQDVQAKMNAKWNATPKAQRDEAIKFEIGLIKSRAETLHESPQWFCSLFVDRIKEGKYDQMIYHPDAKWTPGW
jgi:hypothetical protein